MTDFNSPKGLFFVFGAIAIFIIAYSLFYFRKKTLNKFFSKDILDEILIPRAALNYWIKVSLICISWILLTFAMMQPRGDASYALEKHERAFPTYEKIAQAPHHDIILLVDSSKSMELRDTRGGAARLEHAREIGDQIISKLKGQAVAIDAFTSVTTNISPLTNDYLFARIMLREVGINEGEVAGTNIFEALISTIKKYLSYQSPKLTSIILLSDGGDTALYNVGKEEREKKLSALLNLIDGVKDEKLKIITIGLGSTSGGKIPGVLDDKGGAVTSNLDEELLKKIAQKTDSPYYLANDYPAYLLADNVIKEIAHQENTFADISQGKTHFVKGKEDLIYELFFQYPLGLAIIFLVLAYFFPDTKYLKKTLPVIFFFLCLNLSANDLEVKTNQALSYMEAESLNRAENIFQEIDMAGLKTWQKNRILYNIATIKLFQNQFEEAYQKYLEIEVDPKLSPYLALRIKTNMAAALYLMARQNQNETSLDLYLEALFNIKIAEDANCYLNELLGREQCYSREDLFKLKSQVKRGMAEAVVQYENLKLSELEPRLASTYLLVGIKQILQDINFLQSKNMTEELKKKYLALFIKKIESNLLLWQVFEDDGLSFAKAKADYKRGLKYLIEEQFGISSLMFMSSYVELMKIMYESFGLTPIMDLLQKLDIMYQRALTQEPIQSQSLNLILHDQKRLIRILENGGEEIQKANRFLQEALRFTLKGKNNEAKFMIQVARFWLNILLQKIKTPQEDLVKEKIKTAIFNQEFVFSLNRLIDKMEEAKEEDLDTVLRLQEYTAEEAYTFFDIVLEAEKVEFEKGGPKKPWDRVVTLFEKGYQAAVDSYKISAKRVSKNLQSKALEFWKEALNQLKEKEEIAKEPLKLKEEEQKEKQMTQILNLLQKMNKDDRQPAKRTMKVKEGLYPW